MSLRGAMHLLMRNPLIPLTLVVGAGVITIDATAGGDAARWVATAYVGLVIVWTIIGMVREMLTGHFGLDVLAVVAMIATLAVGEYLAALIIVLMLSGGEALEDFAASRAKQELTALLDRAPRRAHLVSPATGATEDVAVEQVGVGEELLVRPGEIVPVDGTLLSAEASFDESSLTGESLPVTRREGEELLSGAVNGSSAVRIRALRRSEESQYQQIVALVRQAQASRGRTTQLADRFAVPFTAMSLVLGGVAWWLSGDPARFAEVLVLATPCPLLIAAPVAFLGGLSRAAKAGVIIKGGAVIEQLSTARSVAFDKTGTLTAGRPRLIEIVPSGQIDADALLSLAASAEQYSSHVLAEGIRASAIERGLLLHPAARADEDATNGVRALIEGKDVIVGKPAFVAGFAPELRRVHLEHGQAAAYVAIDGGFAGALVFADDPRPESAALVAWLRANGVRRVAMLTGDIEVIATPVAAAVGIDEVHAELLPAVKVDLVRGMQPRPVLMVGDGINDAPALAAADVGVAMGAKGATAAGDAAAAVILKDSLEPLADAIAIAKHTIRVAVTAIWIGIALSLVLMLIAMTGVIPAVAGALVQELVDLATILYALRALGMPRAFTGLPSTPMPAMTTTP